MAQLNDLLVLGNTNLLGAVNSLSTITAPTFDGNATTATTAATANKVAQALTIGAQTYNGSAAITITAKDLGLTGAMVYKGISSTSITDGGSQSPTIGGNAIAVSNLQAGNVVLYGSQEYVWNGSTWELLGDEGSYKLKQTAVSSPAASGNATAFIDTISQDANGRIAVTKKTIPTANTSTLGLTKLHTANDCTTYTSDDGGASPAAVKKAVTLFGDPVYAKLTNPNNLIHSGNEFTFASDAFNGDIYINYRTAAGNQNGNITGYRFCKGAGGTLSDIYAQTYYQNDYGVLDTRNVSGTVNKVPKFIGVNTINNSNITDDGATITLGTKVVVQGNGSSYNEGIRILPASNGWSNVFFSANTTVSGEHDGGWLIGRRGAAGNICGAIGDFTIEEQSSSGANLTIHKDGGGATLQGKMTVNGAGYFCGRVYNSGDDEGVIINFANNGYAGLTLGANGSSARSVFYFKSDGSKPFWRYNNGSASYDISHPGKSGTIALASDFLPISGGTLTGLLVIATNGKTTTFGCQNSSYSHYSTNADAGHWFNKNTYVQGNIYAGSSYNKLVLTEENFSTYAAPASHSHSYLPLSGGTITDGSVTFKRTTATPTSGQQMEILRMSYQNADGTYYGTNTIIAALGTGETGTTNNTAVRFGSVTGSTWITSGESGSKMPAVLGTNNEVLYLTSDASTQFYNGCSNDGTSYTKTMTVDNTKITAHVALYGAVWNDYAEFRICNEDFKPGQVVLENGDDTLSITSQRLQRGCSIVSDTFGFAIGETDEAKCPIAVSGRVLAYGYESREEFKKHIGWPVCSGPNGTVSIMTEEEEEKYPSRIIGTISAVPEYETWGTGNIEVNNRIWIKVR